MTNFKSMRKMSDKELLQTLEEMSANIIISTNDILGELQRRRDKRNSNWMLYLTGIILILTVLLAYDAFSQTRQIEIDNISKRFQNKEFSADEYQRMANVWKETIALYGGYPEFPLNQHTGLVEFEYVKTYELSKKVIYDRIHEWAALTFGNISNVLHYENFDNGKVILKGQFEIIVRYDQQKLFGGFNEQIKSRDCYQTYIFTIKDNKVKLQVTNIEYQYVSATYSNGVVSMIDGKESLHSLYPITNADKDEWKERLDNIYQTKVRLESLMNSLDAYIGNVQADYSF